MRISEIVYGELLPAFKREVMLEDFVRNGCTYRTHLALSGVEGKFRGLGEKALSREIALGVRGMIAKYISEALEEPLSRSLLSHCGVTICMDGILSDGRILDIQPVSTREYLPTRPPRWAVLAACVKATIAKAEGALLVTINRDNQEWNFWGIEGGIEEAARNPLQDLQYIRALSEGDAIAMGTASKNACRLCPYREPCDVGLDESGDPPPYPVDGVRARSDKKMLELVEQHLCALNLKPSGRATHVIHPSEFSTSSCDRRIAYSLLGEIRGEHTSPRLRRVFDTGHVVHAVIQRALRSGLPGFSEEVPVVDEALKITGHCDGRLSEEIGLEIKSIGSKGYSSLTGAKKDHRRQATVYGSVLSMSRIVYLYVCKETSRLSEYDVEIDKALWDSLRSRAAVIVSRLESGVLPERGTRSDWECKSCPFGWKCRPEVASLASHEERRKFR